MGNCNRDGCESVLPKGELIEQTPSWSPLFVRLCDISGLPTATENGLGTTRLMIGGTTDCYTTPSPRLYAEKQSLEALGTQEFV